MIYSFINPRLKSSLILTLDEPVFERRYDVNGEDGMLAIAWNRGESQSVSIDGVAYEFEKNSVMAFLTNHTFTFENPTDIVVWQFNKEFYCIIDHDKEVSCAGFIFYGSNGHLKIRLDDGDTKKFDALLQVFEDEMEEKNDIQEEMLRMLLKRLIILITRLGKKQYLASEVSVQEEDIIRKFNVLVEQHYKEYHQVQDYAQLLNRSPKTLSNTFAKYSSKSPLQVIKARIILESKRLLRYTDKSSKEIAFDLGFDDPATFSRFFKNFEKVSPTQFKKDILWRKSA